MRASYLLTTPRLGLREWRTTGLEPFARMNADPVVMEFFPRLRQEAWGSGFATEAAREVLRYGLEEAWLDRIYSWTAVVNTRSEGVMQKIGMQKLGDFEHPKIGEGSRLRRHVLYEVQTNIPATGTREV